MLAQFVSLTDDVKILFKVKERDTTGMQTFPRQLQLQLLLQSRVGAHGVNPHNKAILQECGHTGGNNVCLHNTKVLQFELWSISSINMSAKCLMFTILQPFKYVNESSLSHK